VSDAIIDSHVHIFGPARTDFARDTPYVPHPSQQGTLQHLLMLMEAHGVGQALLVAARPYGTDNSHLLHALSTFPGKFRGIALIDPRSSDEAQWRSLADHGVVGFRIDLDAMSEHEFGAPAFRRLIAFAREIGWLLEVHCHAPSLAALSPALHETGLRIVVDHFGRPDVADGLNAAPFAAVLEFGRRGNAIVKLSGAFRVSKKGPPYADTDDYVAAIIEAFTVERCVWGSDWPFVATEEHADYGSMLDCLARWIPDPRQRSQVLLANPRRIFRFLLG
jgi:predicted TIM-barrel fold metal-dependent hydrolase